METILVLSFNNLERDPRIHRQIRFLKQDYRVTAVGTADPLIEGVDFISVSKRIEHLRTLLTSPRLMIGHYEDWYWGQPHIRASYEKLSNVRKDLIVANNIETLPLALRLAKGAKIIFDAHEYAPGQMEDILYWRIFFQKYTAHLCKTYIPQTDGMMTVGQIIADTYERETRVKPIVVTNAPDYEDLQPQFSDAEDKVIRMIYHGDASPSRQTDKMIRMMDFLDERYELNLMLIETHDHYLQYLKDLARERPRIRFRPPVPMRTIPKALNQFDVGVYLLEPVNFNLRHALPNKFFEFIQARLAIAIGPSPEMARLVRKHDLGVVSQDFSPQAFADCLRKMDRGTIDHFKLQSHKVAWEMSAEGNKKRLLQLVRQVLEKE